MASRGLKVETQVPVSVEYGGLTLDSALRLDLLVEDQVVVEGKAVEQVLPIHHAQVLTYMKLKGVRVGFLINFFVERFKDGIKRFAL